MSHSFVIKNSHIPNILKNRFGMPIIILCLLFHIGFSNSLLDLPNDPKFYFSTKTSKKKFLLYHRILDRKDLKSWEILLLKPNKENFKIVRRFQGFGYPSKKVRWDGRQIIRTNNKNLKIKSYEGLYYYTIKAKTSSGEVIQSPFIACVLDNTAPSIVVKSLGVFSPNNDGRLDELLLSLDINDYSKNDFFVLDIFDSKNNLIKTYNLKAEDFKKNQYQILWNGSKKDGSSSPEGKYFVQTRSRDLAGNVYQGPKHPVGLIRQTGKVEIKPSADFFNYEDKDNFIALNINRSSDEYWEYDVFTLKNKKNRILLTHTNKSLVNYLEIFSKRFSTAGDYIGQLQSFYRSGNSPLSKKANFLISNKFKVVDVIDVVVVDKVIDKVVDKVVDKKDNVFIVSRDVDAFVVGGKNPVVNKINFSMSSSSPEQMSFTGNILSRKNGRLGKAIFTTNFNASLPRNWTWKGEVNANRQLYTGEYVYELTSENKLKKKIKTFSSPFKVFTAPAKVSISANRDTLTLNNNKLIDDLILSIDMDNITRTRLKQGYLEISQNTKTIKTYPIKKNTKKIVFQPSSLSEKPQDGIYSYSYALDLNAGETVRGGEEFYIDIMPIFISAKISTTAKPISLNKKDVNKLIIKIKHKNSSPFKKGDLLTFSVYNLNLNNQNVSLSNIRSQKKFFTSDELIWREQFQELPKVIKWDGKAPNNPSLQQGVYAISLETKDQSANSWSSNIFFKIVPWY